MIMIRQSTVNILYCVVFLTIVKAIISQRPCMDVVKVIDQQQDRWFADILIKDITGVEGVWLNLTFDKPIHLLTNQFGHAVTDDNKNYLIKKLDFNLEAEKVHVIRVMVKYNEFIFPIPTINKVLLNGRSLCPGSLPPEQPICPPCQESSSSELQSAVGGNGTLPPKVGRRDGSAVVVVDVTKICGTVTIEKDKIIKGELAEEGHYPWQVAIIHTVGVSSQYICSGGLISQRYVLTAGHCVVSGKGNVKSPKELLLYAGSVKLNSNSEHVQVFQVNEIHVNPGYDYRIFKDDIAILEMQSLARITDYVRPLCLPTDKMHVRDLYQRRGIVAGWGYTDTGLVNDLMYIRMPIVSPDTCIYSDRSFYSLFISPRVYCAGARNGTSVCKGDSGAPMVLDSDETGEDRFYSRGIVSLSKASFGLACDPNDFAIFTDVVSFMPWIRDIVDV